MGKIYRNGIEFSNGSSGGSGGGGNVDMVEMTYAQYNALTTAQKNDGTVRFIIDIDNIPDAEGTGF